jgi:hypothetical protein
MLSNENGGKKVLYWGLYDKFIFSFKFKVPHFRFHVPGCAPFAMELGTLNLEL